MLTAKQSEYVHNANHRWNVKTGATGAGKTYMDVALMIPARLRHRSGLAGLNVIIGNTKGTLTRNIIEPMQELYGTSRVSSIRSDNMAFINGEKVFCIGADNKKQVDRLRGSTIKYCYGDEVTTWNKEVFELLKSRLRTPESLFDGTCNPEGQNHWFKKFLDSDADIYQQAYVIDDNPYLPEQFVSDLKHEYEGTIYYDRYILGRWTAAEGIIYRRFADKPDDFMLYEAPQLVEAVIGVDFGGGKSGHSFTCVGFTAGYRMMIILADYWCKDALDPETLNREFGTFVQACHAAGYPVYQAWCDSEESTLINGMANYAASHRLGINVGKCMKKPINDRIRFMCGLMGTGRVKILRHCTNTIDALQTAVWDSKHDTDDSRLDDGTSNIDSLDSMEYAYERYMNQMGFVR